MTAQPGAEAPLPSQSAGSGAAKLVIPCLIGALVALTLGIYGHIHHPTGIAVNLAGFSGPHSAKSWLATGAIIFALIQVISALVMYGKIRSRRRRGSAACTGGRAGSRSCSPCRSRCTACTRSASRATAPGC